MKLKLDEAGHVVVQDGKPVYVHDDGKEVAFDAQGTVATITRLNGEAKGHREAKEAAIESLKAFEGITDPAAALNAIELIKKIDDKKLLDAGKVDEIKAAAIKSVEEKYAPVVKERDQLKNDLHAEKIGGSFSRSKFIADKLAIPGDMVEARFGRNFAIDGGKIVAKDASGNPIYSRSKPGEVAEFDEALEILVDAYPQKDHILKGSGAGGGGAKGGAAAGSGAKSMTRTQFDALGPVERATAMKEKVALVEG